MSERSAVDELFAKQEVERQEFVQGQIDRLNEAKFDWKLPEDFKSESGYQGKGLVTQQSSTGYEILHPDQGLVYVGRADSPVRIPLMGGGMTGSGISQLKTLEIKVNEVVAQLTTAK